MKTTHILTNTLLVSVCSLFLMSCGENKSSISSSELFTDAPEQSPLSNELNTQEPLVLKRRLVKVNVSALLRLAIDLANGEKAPLNIRVHLDPFKDEKLQVVLQEVEKVSEGNIIFTGQIEGDDDSAVTLVVNDGQLVANVRKSDRLETYEVRYAASGIHTIDLKIDGKDDGCTEVETGETEDEAFAEDFGADNELFAEAIYYVDILGAYTPNARSKMGGTSGIIALLQLGIADTNRAMQDSGANVRVRLAGTIELRQNETGNWSRDLGYLKGKGDGRWEEVHSKRSQVGADQVTLVATYPNTSGTAGIGFIRSTASSAFTIVRHSAFSQYTFSHELGHNLGLRHSDGYVNSSGRFRTIIAYGSYPRIRRYANPLISYKGYRTGNSSHNEVSIINSRASTVSRLVPMNSLYAFFPWR